MVYSSYRRPFAFTGRFEDIKKEKSELKRIKQEFARKLSDGAQDMAKLKSAEMTQKQMRIQAMRLQIGKLEKPGKSGEAAGPAETDGSYSGREKFDRFVKSDENPEEAPGLYRLETDENGNQRIVFDRAEQEKEGDKASPDGPAPDADDKKPGPEDEPKKSVEVGKSVGDDSQWKAEIDKIKQKKSQLSQVICNARDDEGKRRALEAQLAQLEAELAAKDTESYRKQRTVVRYLGAERMDAADAAKLN